MKKKSFATVLQVNALFALISMSWMANGQTVADVVLWKQGEGNHKNYRIPSVILTSQGSLLAFCEGREAGDAGDIDILLRRSTDNGLTWGKEIVVWDDTSNTCGNPCPVVDHVTGRIWLFLTWNRGTDHERDIINKRSTSTRLPYVCYSDDDGLTWSVPALMKGIKELSWGWYATGPGIGIQLQRSIYAGRLVVPANHSYDDPQSKLQIAPYGYGSHVIYSDDHGMSWHLSLPIRPGCNESQLTELGDGTLLMNMRSYNDMYCRAVSMSTDGGSSWSQIEHDLSLVESKCQASLLEYGPFDDGILYIFSNPAVPIGRKNLTIRASFDDCSSWSNSKLVFSGPSAYSCLVRTKDDNIGLLFECGTKNRYEIIRFVSFPPEAIFEPGPLLREL
ncbi:MAG: exo-alpha-sialidase [Bacteroidia bacterium]|nr:MAG: exo-alpha-sialidase [Bacteroidia bacterium]